MGWQGRKIWLVGASEGIGRELAKQLASKGASVAVSARNEERLKTLHASLEGEAHLYESMDVTDMASVAAAFHEIHNRWGHIDMLIYNAGAYTPMKAQELDAEDAWNVTNVNLGGAYRVLEKIIPTFVAQKSGHIALVASVAGYRGLPNAMGYGASKAAMQHLAENVKADLATTPIHVQMINPGFVKTRLTDKNDFDMPAMLAPEDAAKRIVDGLETPKTFDIHFPKRFTLWLKLMQFLPSGLYFWIMKHAVKNK